jgi:hypothetical protein
MRMMSVIVVSLAAALLPAAARADAGKATGQITVAGKATTLSYAYAAAKPGFFDKKKNDVVVIFSDVPLDQKALDDDFARIDMVRAGTLHTLEVTIDADKAPISVTVRHPALKPAPSGGSTDDQFDARVFDGRTIAGRVYRKAPGMSFNDIPYSYDVTFEAAIAPKAK